MIIYKVENLINGKTYIGRTVTSLENRRWQHFHTADKNAKTIFHFAIKKYGKSNFKFSTIKTCNSIESLNKWERIFIRKFNSKVPNGYNMTPGGDGLPKGWVSNKKGIPLSKEQKEKLRQANLGKRASEETKKKMSIAHKGNTYCLGKPSPKKGIPTGVPAWNKGLKGFLKGKTIWNKGLKGIKTSNKGQVPWNKGLTKDTDERVKKNSDSLQTSASSCVFRKGQIPWNKGVKTIHSKESNLKRSLTMKGKKKPLETLERMKRAQIERRTRERLNVNR